MTEPRSACDLSIPASLLFLQPALAFAESLALSAGFETGEALSIRLALEETLENIITHGYPDGEDGTIDLRCEVLAGGLRLTVREKGLPYDPGAIAPFDPLQADLGGGISGLGTLLVRHAVDEVLHRNLGRQGRETVLTKNLPARHVARLLGLEGAPRGGGDQAEAPAPQLSYSVRHLRPEDALEVSRCAYMAYGYTYVDFIYYPERIAALNQEGTLLSVVAVGEGGEFLGHAAAKRDDPSSPAMELGVLLVSPRYRARGVARSLGAAAVERARAAGAQSVYVRAVSGHTVSQRLAENQGMRPCAVMLGSFPWNVDFRMLAGVVPGKMSSVAMWMPLEPQGPRRIFPPERHREWVERLYGALGLEPGGADRRGQPPAVAGQVESRFSEATQTGEVLIPDCGAAHRAEVLGSLRRLLSQGADAVYCLLNLEHPEAPAMAGVLEDQGCFFSGILPGRLAGRDALVLQRMNGLAIRYEDIHLENPLAQELLAYIRSQDPGQSGAAATA